MTASFFFGRPKSPALETKSAVMPRSRLEPERLAKQSRPASHSIFSSIRQVVVLPLVPVTTATVTPRASRPSMSGQMRSATLPGRAVPPRPSRRSASLISLQQMMASTNLIG